MDSFWKGRKVLVTGGCGFLGSYMTEALVEADAHVTVADNLERGILDNIAHLGDSVSFLEEDLVNLDACLRAADGQDTVMNLVGRVHGVGYSSKHHGEMLFFNAVTHLNMLEAARRQGVKRFLVVSSSCVYPDDAQDLTPELHAMTRAPEADNEGYGWAKRIAELQGEYYANEFGMDIAICRPVNTIGGRYPWRGFEGSFVIPSLVKKIMDGDDPVEVWGSGRQRRNFLHARDAAKMMMIVTERYACGRPVNIGHTQDVSIAEIVDLICDLSGKRPRLEFNLSKPEGRLRKHVDISLLKQIAPDYTPETTLEEGIKDVLAWYGKTFAR